MTRRNVIITGRCRASLVVSFLEVPLPSLYGETWARLRDEWNGPNVPDRSRLEGENPLSGLRR
jgi:hypothetical protein